MMKVVTGQYTAKNILWALNIVQEEMCTMCLNKNLKN